jgi:hypothetical protein
MSTQNNKTQSISGEQIMAAFINATRYSDEVDARGNAEGSARSWARLDTFVDALGREVELLAPGLHNQLMAYRRRVAQGENLLRTAREIAEGNSK